MNNKTNNNQTPVRALELLPWYALGLLEPKDKSYVEKMLLEFPELQAHLKTEHEMAQFLKEEKELFSLSAIEERENRLTRLLEREEFSPEKVEKQKPTISTRFINFFKDLISGHVSKTQYAGFAAVTTLSIALLFAFAMPLLERNSTFYPAGIESEEGKLNTNSLLVGLSVAPNDPRLLKILKKHNVKISAIEGKDGMYQLGFTKKTNASDLDKLLSILSKQTELIWFVGEAY